MTKRPTNGLLGKLKSTGKVSRNLEEVKEQIKAAPKPIAPQKPSKPQPVPHSPDALVSNLPDDALKTAVQPNIEDVSTALKEYSKGLGSQKALVLFGSPLRWESLNKVCISYENPILKEVFRDFSPAAGKFLTEKFSYPILLSEEVTQLQQEQKLYTDFDKMGFLMEKYPQFQKLKDALGLDLDS